MSQFNSGYDVLNNIAKLLEVKGEKLPENLQRIVVDIPVTGAVRVYYQTIGGQSTIDAILDASLQVIEEQKEGDIIGHTLKEYLDEQARTRD